MEEIRPTSVSRPRISIDHKYSLSISLTLSLLCWSLSLILWSFGDAWIGGPAGFWIWFLVFVVLVWWFPASGGVGDWIVVVSIYWFPATGLLFRFLYFRFDGFCSRQLHGWLLVPWMYAENIVYIRYWEKKKTEQIYVLFFFSLFFLKKKE
jgi:hypothetical protein